MTTTAERPMVETKRVLVTPDLATQWLEHNEVNREVRQSAVAQRSRDMEMGYWDEMNPQPVIFDDTGALIDGQHRLLALKKSGRSLWMSVATNVPRKTQLVIDDSLVRHVHDYAKWEMPGHKIRSEHVAIARTMLGGITGSAAQSGRLSRSILYAFLRKHLPNIEHAIEFFTKRVPSVTQSATFAVIARALYTQDAVRLRRFAELLQNGEMDNRDEVSAITVRTWLLTKSSGSKRERYAKTERALWAYLSREQLSKAIAAKEELFPLPEEVLQAESENTVTT